MWYIADNIKTVEINYITNTMTVVIWQGEGGVDELKLSSLRSLENGTMYFNISIYIYKYLIF